MAIISKMQQNEITEYHIYMKLARIHKHEGNRKILGDIARDEKRHHDFWVPYSGKDAKPKRRKVFFTTLLARIFGLTFTLKLMEKGEEKAQDRYSLLLAEIPETKAIIQDEDNHENELLNMLEEERLQYISSIVLGLNDALVELTGALAGLTFALQNTRLIAMAGLITGIAASFSMAASEYLSNRSEGRGAEAVKSATYTGIAYIITVMLLILPYLLFPNFYLCLALTLSVAVLIIFFFNYYLAVAKDLVFWKRFLEMAGLSLGVAGISFAIGVLVRTVLGIDI
ncbi:MAG: VIT1/CCC1 transporter family protein [Spirochaetales bacterium]|nr:VIT1/CCC1 transporter family protein [Spirochaetales bacterium]